ncbi:MAG: hypothetical protein MI757_11595, partial [Pirellulales bacterium]|nr:hypothetical protein [Pirellulales bacterium]
QQECARRAARFEPTDFATRERLARTMIEQELYAEAEPHVRWCLRRRPSHAGMRRALTEIIDFNTRGSQVELVSGEGDLSDG